VKRLAWFGGFGVVSRFVLGVSVFWNDLKINLTETENAVEYVGSTGRNALAL
jgi:hypothetical protein